MKHRFLRSLPVGLSLGLLAPGCAGGQSGTEGEDKGPACEELDATAIGPDEITAAGTPLALSELAAGEARVPLTWYGHGATPSSGDTELTIGVSALLGTARWVAQRAIDGVSESCPDFLAMDADVTFDTADSTFDDVFRGSIVTEDGATARFSGSFAARELVGSYDASDVLSIYVDPEYSVRLWWSPEPSGNVSLSGGDADEDPSTISGSALVAEFGAGVQ